jgi:hydrogenase/urease accessory protein HupE
MAPSLLEIVEAAPGQATVRWKTPANKVPGPGMHPNLPRQCTPTTAPREEAVETAIVRTWDIECDEPLTGSIVSVDGIGASRADVILRISLADGRVFNTVLKPESASYEIPERERSGEVFRSYARLGVEHILTGFDHLLFVFGLLLLVSNRKQLLWTVTAFTVGHSVTLSLATLGFVEVPTAPIEAAIAFSILLVAIEVARGTEPTPSLMRRFPWAIAFAFGLLHGFGFAGALSEIGLPQGEIPLALFSFNLGIEAGQLLFCAVVIGIYEVFRLVRTGEILYGRVAAAYVIGTLAAYWFFERAAASL